MGELYVITHITWLLLGQTKEKIMISWTLTKLKLNKEKKKGKSFTEYNWISIGTMGRSMVDVKADEIKVGLTVNLPQC